MWLVRNLFDLSQNLDLSTFDNSGPDFFPQETTQPIYSKV